METILEVEELRKVFPGFELRDVGFRLERGCVMGFIGRNGAGKTTTIKLIMNLIRPDGGSIRLFGRKMPEGEIAAKERIGFVYDESCFYSGITVAETARVVAPFYRNWRGEEFERLTRDFGLDPTRKIGQLSRGQKTLFALAVALSHDAELIIMDEPTSGLDPVFRSELIDLLYDIIQDERRAVLFSTHLTADLEKVADYVTLIDRGRILLSDSKDLVLDRYRIVRGPAERLTQQARSLCVGIRETKSGFEALSASAEEVAALIGQRCVTERASLDEIMVYLVGRQNHGQ